MKKNSLKLINLNIKGYKSIDQKGMNIPIGNTTVLLGANGAGKSNLVSFFKMLNYIMKGALQKYVGDSGFADSLLHYGSKKTQKLSANVFFSDTDFEYNYIFSLSHAAGDTLVFSDETFMYKTKNDEIFTKIPIDLELKESGLQKYCNIINNKQVSHIYNFMKACQVFQFHDTSKEASIRNNVYINDGDALRSNGGNLPAFLYAMKSKGKSSKYYNRIIRYIKMVMPNFKDFVLKPSALNENYIMLNWLENDSDYLFGVHQISDGSLRFMALATLLLQSPETLPKLIILDEPELGLHPFAISILVGMIKTASQNSQILLATQSTRLVDEFSYKDIIIVERIENSRCSNFKTLDINKLNNWIDQYSMSELWEKNILGGRP